MKNIDYIEKNTNNDYVIRYNLNDNFDRTSLYLYENALGTGFAPHPPLLEEYGCDTIDPIQRYVESGTTFNNVNFEDGTTYSEFDPFGAGTNNDTYLERNCPQYQASKLYPVKRNPNNVLANTIGPLNLTFLAKSRLASPFFYNGAINGVGTGALVPDANLNDYICNSNCKTITSGYQAGPRFTLISNNIAITAKHYTNPENPQPLIGQIYSIIGTDDIEYSFRIIDAATTSGTLDLHMFKIEGYGANPIQTGIELNKIKPISVLDCDYSDIDYLLFKQYIQNICPVITIDHENRCVLDFSFLFDSNLLGLGIKTQTGLNIFSFYNLQYYLEKFNLNNIFNIEDISSQLFIGDSSSPYFILENNEPVLLGLYTTYRENTKFINDKIINNNFCNAIKQFAIQKNCTSPKFVKLDKNNILEKINYFNKITDNQIYFIKNNYFYKNTNNDIISDYSLIPVQNNIKYNIPDNIFYSATIQYIYTRTFNFSLGTIKNRSLPLYYEITIPSVYEIENLDPEFYCTEDVKVNYNINQIDYNNMVKYNFNNKKLLKNTTNPTAYKRLFEKINSNSKINLKRNNTYYLNIPLTINNFYVSTEPNNINKKYENGFKQISEKLFYELSPYTYFNLDLTTINMQNLNCDYESISFPIEHNYLILPQPVGLINCNNPSETFIANEFDDFLILKFEVPENCPSKLYFCTPDLNYIELIIEDEKPSMEKAIKYSYINISPKIKVINDKINVGVEYEGVEGYLGAFFRTCRNVVSCFNEETCYPNPEENLEQFNEYAKSILEDTFPYILEPQKTEIVFIENKGIKSSDNYDIDIIRKE
jgi:hypothetical protein